MTIDILTEVHPMSAVVDLRKSDDPRDAIHRAVHLLVQGGVVAFPTETAYALCAYALSPQAIGRLAATASDAENAHAALIVKSFEEALDYVPSIDRLGQRLARRCWPGPVTLAFDVSSESGLFCALPAETQKALAPDGRLWIRVPAHDCIQEAIRLIPAPLVAGSEFGQEGKTFVTAATVLAARGDDGVDLIIDDGESRYAQPATVVRVANGSWSIVQPGVVTETIIGRLASEVFVFICTGNTCRSPLAEAFCRKMLAERLKCAEDELSDHGYMILSAGLAAEPGLAASPESVEIAREHGADLRSHESQPLTDRLLEQADRIFTMTASHKEAILASHPQLSDRVEMLSRDNNDIPDPIGAGRAEYEACSEEIKRNLRAIMDQLPQPPSHKSARKNGR